MSIDVSNNILSVLHASTQHVTRAERNQGQACESIADTLTVMSGQRGWLTYVPPREGATSKTSSDGFRKICMAARASNIPYVWFSDDVEPIEGIDTYA